MVRAAFAPSRRAFGLRNIALTARRTNYQHSHRINTAADRSTQSGRNSCPNDLTDLMLALTDIEPETKAKVTLPFYDYIGAFAVRRSAVSCVERPLT